MDALEACINYGGATLLVIQLFWPSWQKPKWSSRCIKSYEIMLETLRREPSSVRCNNTLCISCYGRFSYNGFGVASFYPRKAVNLLLKLLGVKK